MQSDIIIGFDSHISILEFFKMRVYFVFDKLVVSFIYFMFQVIRYMVIVEAKVEQNKFRFFITIYCNLKQYIH